MMRLSSPVFMTARFQAFMQHNNLFWNIVRSIPFYNQTTIEKHHATDKDYVF